jgi:DNA-binding CsgD family transcriptional regulator
MPEIVTVHGERDLVARAGHLFASVEFEFLCAARDLATWQVPEARAAIRDRMPQNPGRILARKLLSPVALADEDGRRHLRDVTAQGTQVSITATPLPQETIIIDRRVLILAGPDSPHGREYTVTTDPTLVGGVHALYTAAWETATSFTAFLAGDLPHLDADGRAVLRLLGSGRTDETAARQLGLSLRTYRRRVADLLAALDAGSRFQAGVRAGTLGLTR